MPSLDPAKTEADDSHTSIRKAVAADVARHKRHLKGMMARAGLSPEELAERAGLGAGQIARTLSESRPSLGFDELLAVLAALGTTPTRFFQGLYELTPYRKPSRHPDGGGGPGSRRGSRG